MSVKGKVALISAAASGIGEKIAERFADEGAKLILCDIDQQRLEDLEERLKGTGAEVLAVKCDVGNTQEIDNLFEKGIERFKTVDILVNTVGIEGPTENIEKIDESVWDDVMRINVKSVYYMIKKASPYMIEQKSGKIVNFSSVAGKDPLPFRAPYCASKMAIIGLSRCAASELGMHNITVNTICPAMVEGDRFFGVMKKQADKHGMSFQQMKQMGAANLPLRRYVKANDVVEMTLFLSDSAKSNSVTSQDFNVDCGFRSF